MPACRHVHAIGKRRRLVARPTVNPRLGKARLFEHLQERPFPYSTGNSVGPGAEPGYLLGGDIVFQQDVRHQESAARAKHPSGFGQGSGLVRA